MVRVALLISDHGWGHAGRMSALIDEVAGRGWPTLVLAGEAIAASLRERHPATDVRAAALDRGLVVRPGGRGVDPDATRARLRESLAQPDAAVRAAVAGWRPDVIVADATPWGADLARAGGAASVLCSNFSWEEQYASLLGETDEVAALRERVARFDVACRLPLGTGLGAVAEQSAVGLLTRMPRLDAGAALRAHGLDPSVAPVAWAMGRSPAAEQPLELLAVVAEACAGAGIPVVASASLAGAGAGLPRGIHLVPDDVYWPDLLAASRLVVSKAGYSTIAETLRGPGRVLVLRGLHTAEESGIARDVAAGGYGTSVDFADGWDRDAVRGTVETLLALPPREPVTERGEVAVADLVESLTGPARGGLQARRGS